MKDIVIEYLRKYPSSSSRKLAELICKEVPGAFADAEKARNAIRYYRGSKGQSNRDHLSAESYVPKVTMPSPEPEDWKPYIFERSSYPIIVGGDAHIPYHDQDALELFIERAVEMGARTILLAGDWLDCYQLSRWEKDPRKRSIKEEIGAFKDVIEVIKAATDAKIVYKLGNHESRLERYIMANAPALFGLDNITLPALINAAGLGIEIIPSLQIIRADHLNIVHGHEFGQSIFSPVNPARGLYMRAKKSALCFHHHRASSHSETAINGDRVITWSGGCLCGLHPEYMPINNWSHGFAEIYHDGEMFNVRNREIVNYRLV